MPRLRHDYADAFPELIIDWEAEESPDPALVILDEDLAAELGLDPEWLRSPAGVRFLAGMELPDDARPVAQAYSGHQFGMFNPMLGDGRALLLGELEVPDGRVVDVHLKGSGPTPFSRGGDGRATVDTMLREHVMGVAMHALGVPTTRALAVLTTGRPVVRSRALPGAILVRVAAGHERVGTAQFLRAHRPEEMLREWAWRTLRRHHPGAEAAAERDGVGAALLEAVMDAQISLVARWMGLGFIHGVMNTDNIAMSGETIDYGPCAMLDAHAPDTWFSSVDERGRYRYGHQPRILQWDLLRFAEALLPLMGDEPQAAVDAATELMGSFPDRWAAARRAEWLRKLGLAGAGLDDETSDALIDDWTRMLADAKPDHTGTHRALADAAAGDDEPVLRHLGDGHAERAAAWLERWRRHSPDADALRSVNPVYVPRNHLVEGALDAAADGDLGPYRELVDVLRDPFTERPGLERYAQPAPPDFYPYRTFCGT
ncbi:protein adenylyltransferase SelO [Corynebacterium sp. 335C]